MTSRPNRSQDFPPGLQGGLENDAEDHRVGETGQVGPEAPGDVNRGHPEQGERPSRSGPSPEGEDSAERAAGG